LRKEELTETLRRSCVFATVQVPGEQQLLRAVTALSKGGMRAIELPYTTVKSAGWVIQALKDNGLMVGVGAITRSSQAREAGMLGADFITAVVTTPDVVSSCKEMDIPCMLSGLTPTEVWRAQEMGADLVKVPAGVLGGPDYIRSLRESLPALHLVGAEMPLNGYHPYLEAGVEVLEFKNSLAIQEMVEREEWAEISRRASGIVNACNDWRTSHNLHA